MRFDRMETKGTKRSSSHDKTQNKRLKNNERQNEDDITENRLQSTIVKDNKELEKTINLKIQEILESEKDRVEAQAQVLLFQGKCLRQAAEEGQHDIFDNLIKIKDIDANIPNKEGQTALMLAAQYGHVDIVKRLLSKCINVEVTDIHGYSALLHCVANNQVEVLKLLLAKSIKNINQANHVQTSALVLAANRGYHRCVQELLSYKETEVNCVDGSGDSALIHAAEEGHAEVVELLLTKPNIEVNLKNGNGDVALMCASNRGHNNIVNMLLKMKDIDVNTRNNDGYTALMCAADKGNCEVAKLLLANKMIDVNIVDENNDNAINWAVDKDHKEIVRLIFRQGHVEKNEVNLKLVKDHLRQGKPNGKDLIFEWPLITAIRDGELDIVRWILPLDKPHQINRREGDTTPLITAIRGDSREIFHLILRQDNVDVNATDSNNYSPLAWAAAWADKHDLSFLEDLINHPDIKINQQDNEGYTPLGRAAAFGRWKALLRLCQVPGIDGGLCSEDSSTPLLAAVEAGCSGEVVASLVRCKGVDVNCGNIVTGYTPLIWASDAGYVEVIVELLKHPDIRINQPDKNGYTALIWAADLDQPDIVRILCQQPDIEVNATDVDGHTALIWATDKGNIEVVNHLLNHKKIDVNIQDQDGLSALMCAVTLGKVEVAKRLLECEEVDVNLQDNDERHSALIAAVNKNMVNMVELLLEHPNLDLNLKDKYGTSAYMLAKFKGYNQILRLFARMSLIVQHPQVKTPILNKATKGGRKLSNNIKKENS